MKMTAAILKKFGWSVEKYAADPTEKCYYRPDGAYSFEAPNMEEIAKSLGLKYKKFPGKKLKPDVYSPRGYYAGYWVDASGTSLGSDLEAILKRVLRDRS